MQNLVKLAEGQHGLLGNAEANLLQVCVRVKPATKQYEPCVRQLSDRELQFLVAAKRYDMAGTFDLSLFTECLHSGSCPAHGYPKHPKHS
jgi:hypothetical protein